MPPNGSLTCCIVVMRPAGCPSPLIDMSNGFNTIDGSHLTVDWSGGPRPEDTAGICTQVSGVAARCVTTLPQCHVGRDPTEPRRTTFVTATFEGDTAQS